MKQRASYIYRITIAIVSLFFAAACEVHEWPVPPDTVPYHLKLRYETDMLIWNHEYDGNDVNEVSVGPVEDNIRKEGTIRYIVRTYPAFGNKTLTDNYIQEFIFTQDIKDGYDFETDIELKPGDYEIVVWSDLIENATDKYFYNADKFIGIALEEDTHRGSNDYRDCFRGGKNISVESYITEKETETILIDMQRPVAKFEFIATDYAELLQKIDTDELKVIFLYTGFMPDTYSIFTDKPTDAKTNVIFGSVMREINDNEVSLGFDYIFINGQASKTNLQVGVVDKNGDFISLSKTITVPIKRSNHSVIRGEFLTTKTSSGVGLNPDYDGNYNLIFP